jgi:hypothetical protein
MGLAASRVSTALSRSAVPFSAVSAAGAAVLEAGAEAEAPDTEDGAEEALPPQPVRATASTALTAITESFVRFIIKYSFFC